MTPTEARALGVVVGKAIRESISPQARETCESLSGRLRDAIATYANGTDRAAHFMDGVSGVSTGVARPEPAPARGDRGPRSGDGAGLRPGDRVRVVSEDGFRMFHPGHGQEYGADERGRVPQGGEVVVADVLTGSAEGDEDITPEFTVAGGDGESWTLEIGDFERIDDLAF